MKKKDKTLLKIIESPHASQFYNGFVWNIRNMELLELKGVQKVKEHRYFYLTLFILSSNYNLLV